jgi:hypothetical protein
MGARTGEEFLKGLRARKRELWLGDERVDDVTEHPALAGAARALGSARPLDYALRGVLVLADGTSFPFVRRGEVATGARR